MSHQNVVIPVIDAESFPNSIIGSDLYVGMRVVEMF
jgi:hypothetical protein